MTNLLYQQWFYILGDLNPVACTESPQKPSNVQAYAVSRQQIVVYWTKPVGPGYTSQVRVTKNDVWGSPTVKDRGVSPTLAEGITLLDANTAYNVSVQLSCTNNKELFSEAVYTTVTTFPEGEFL